HRVLRTRCLVPLTLSFPPFSRLTVLQFGLLSLLIVPAPEPVSTLHWHFSERHPLYVRLKSHEKCRDKKYGQETSHANELEILHGLKLLKRKDDGSVLLELYIQSYTQRVVGGPEVPGVRAAEGAVLRITLSKQMKVTQIDGLEVLSRSLLRIPPPFSPSKEQLKQLHEGVEVWLEDVLIPLPEGHVAAGAHWSRRREIDQQFVGRWASEKIYTDRGPCQLDGRTVRKFEVTARVKITGPVSVPPGCPYEDCKGELKANDYRGTAWFDPEAGRLVKNQWTFRRHFLA